VAIRNGNRLFSVNRLGFLGAQGELRHFLVGKTSIWKN